MVTFLNSVKALKIIPQLEILGFYCISPKANLMLRWVYVSVFVGVGAVVAVLGAILLLVAICLIIGATKVSDTFTLLSSL
jgi:hypothetical protein